MQSDAVRLLVFWAMISVPCLIMLLLARKYGMGDRYLIRRTLIYFLSVFLVLPLVAFVVFQSSPSLAKIGFLTFFLLGTAVYFVMTASAVLRPKS
jgi:hypothetical protein